MTVDAETADAREGTYKRTERGEGEDVPTDGETRIRAFKAAFSALRCEERGEALRWARSMLAQPIQNVPVESGAKLVV